MNLKREALFLVITSITGNIASFCFLNDIDPIFEELDSIYCPFYLIDWHGLDNYI